MSSQYNFEEVFKRHIGLLEQNTIKQYVWEKALLLQFCEKINKIPWQLFELDCQLWATERLQRPGHFSRPKGRRTNVSAYTVFQAACRWRKVWRRALETGAVTTNPWQSVCDSLERKAKPCQKRPTEKMTDEDIKKLLDACDLETKRGVGDKAFFSLLFGGGLRLNEATGVKVCDLRFDGKVYSVLLPETKSQEVQKQKLPAWANENIERLIIQRSMDGIEPDSYLFNVYSKCKAEFSRNKPYTHEAWRKRWEKYREDLKLKDSYTTHSGRTSACNKLLDEGVDRIVIQDFMRHATPRMVDEYDRRRVLEANHGSKYLEGWLKSA